MDQLKSTLVYFFVLCFGLVQGQTWMIQEPVPNDAARNHPVTFSLNGYGYTMGGGANAVPYNDMYRFDPISGTWEQLNDFPGTARSLAYAVTDGEFAYMGFGRSGFSPNVTFHKDFWKYDPINDTWEELSPCACPVRSHPAMVFADNKIYVGMGNNTSNLNDWWAYDIATDTWEQKDNLPGPIRHHPYYFGIDGKAYVGFGHGASIYNDFYIFDPATDEWTQLNNFPGEARVAGTQFDNNGKGYILSGSGSNHDFMPSGEFWEYDPATDTWLELPPHPGISIWAPGSFVVNDMVYFLQGERLQHSFGYYELLDDMWAFDLAALVSSNEDINEVTYDLTAFPNPVTDQVRLVWNDATNPMQTEEVMYQIFSTNGQLQQSGRVNAQQLTLDVNQLPSGIYTVLLTAEGQQSAARFVKG